MFERLIVSEVQKHARFGGIGEAFSDRNFRIYSVGSIGSWTSYFIQIVAVGWLTWELTESTQWLAVMTLLDIIPNVVLMPLAGALADRYDRHKILMLTSVLSMLQALVLAVFAWQEVLTIGWLAALVLIHGIIISFMVPAMYGTIPRFVARERVASAIAVSSSYTQLAVFLGPAFAGWIILVFGTTFAFVANVIGYAVLITAFACLETPSDFRQPPRSSRSLFSDITDGFSYIGKTPMLVPLLLILLIANALASGFFHMMPAYADTVLGLGVVGMSTMLSMAGLGAIAAALWLAYGGGDAARSDRILWSFLIGTAALAGMLLTTNLFIAAGLAAILGFAQETRRTSTITIIQLAVDEAQRGRVMGTFFMIAQLAAAIGTYLIGAYAVRSGLKTPILVGSVFSFGIWIIFFLYRDRFFPIGNDKR